MLDRPEILAPAGTKAALVAAVNAGADAVYVGGELFSARAFAGNFSTAELIECIDFCHIRGVKLYMAVNTLLKNNEISQLISYIAPFYEAGVDGIIVQDMGVFCCLKKAFPGLPLHGSTQMSVTTAHGASYLKSLGMSRIVPARELALSDIVAIKNDVDIELETFVHGAMCFAYSGKCLMSSFAGGRSGNRGRCAQICRKSYTIDGGSSKYAISMKDMCTLPILGELVDAGIDSFKIEGRMKKPEYVAATVDAYKCIRDAHIDGVLTDKLVDYHMDRLADIYNRGGFSTGYYHMAQGKEMLASARPNHTGVEVGKVVKVAPPKVHVALSKDVNKGDVLAIRSTSGDVELTSGEKCKAGGKLVLNGHSFGKISKGMAVYRMKNPALIDCIEKTIIATERKNTVHANVFANVGEPLSLSLADDSRGVAIQVKGSLVEKAQNSAVADKDIYNRLGKTGGTGIALHFDKEKCFVGEDIFVPVSSINSLRREAVEELSKEIANSYKRTLPEDTFALEGVEKVASSQADTTITAACQSLEILDIINNYDFVDSVVIDYNIAKEGLPKVNNSKKPYVALPYVMRAGNEKFTIELVSLAKENGAGVVIRNLDQLALVKELHFDGPIICDSFLYAYNSQAKAFCKEELAGARFIASVELTQAELESDMLDTADIVKAYGHQPVMITAQELASGSNHITRMVDDMKNTFYIKKDSCANVIYNGVPTDNREGLVDAYSVLIDFTVESPKEAARILDGIACGDYDLKTFTRGHYKKGID